MPEKQHISLFKLQSIIRERLEDAMPLPCWVTAEISEMKVNYSGHCYLELVEKGGENAIPRARASAVIWRSTFGPVASYFRSATGAELTEGMNVLMKVSVSYHELYGLSLVVSDIDPLYTIGDMERLRRETIDRLVAEGVYDMNRELGMPAVVQRVAVVSSRNAAGYQDFMNELAASGYAFGTDLFDAFMQGQSAEDSIIGALERIAQQAERYDAVVVIRGGGSQSDLGAFDSYRLCSHIAQFPLPVVAGIGHDKDQSVADLVAAVSLKTPTAVAAWLVEGLAEFDLWLDTAREKIVQSAETMIEAGKQQVRQAAWRLSHASSSMARSLELRLERLSGEIARHGRISLVRQENMLAALASAVGSRASARIAAERLRLDASARIVGSRQPESILSMGFAIVRREGKVVVDSTEVHAGELLDITLAKGKLNAKVEK